MGGRECYYSKIPFHIPQLSFFLPDAVVPGQGQQPQVSVVGMICQQETFTITLNLYIRIHKGLMDYVVLYKFIIRNK